MKENYKIAAIGNSIPLLEKYNVLKRGRKFDLAMEKTALLIIDMQKYFFDPLSHACIPAGGQIVQPISMLADLAQKKGFPVYLTCHIDEEKPGNQMVSWWDDKIDEKDEKSLVIEELKNHPNTIKKPQYDIFHNTNIEEILKNQGIHQVIFTGVVTHLCVETSIRSAFIRGFLPILPIDGTAAYNLDQHVGSVKNLGHGFAVLTQIHNLISLLEAL